MYCNGILGLLLTELVKTKKCIQHYWRNQYKNTKNPVKIPHNPGANLVRLPKGTTYVPTVS